MGKYYITIANYKIVLLGADFVSAATKALRNYINKYGQKDTIKLPHKILISDRGFNSGRYIDTAIIFENMVKENNYEN